MLPIWRAFQWVMRHGNVDVDRAGAELEMEASALRALVSDLAERGFLREMEVSGKSCQRAAV